MWRRRCSRLAAAGEAPASMLHLDLEKTECLNHQGTSTAVLLPIVRCQGLGLPDRCCFGTGSASIKVPVQDSQHTFSSVSPRSQGCQRSLY